MKTTSSQGRFSYEETTDAEHNSTLKQLIPQWSAEEFLETQPEALPPSTQVVSEKPKLLITVSDDLPEGANVPAGFSFLGNEYDQQLIKVQLLELQLSLYEHLHRKAEKLYHERIAAQPKSQRNEHHNKLEQALYAINSTIATELRPGQDNAAYKHLMEGLDHPRMHDTLGQEVCLQKSLIAHDFLRSLGFQSKLALESYPGQNKEGHAYVLIYRQGTRQKFHPNMPRLVVGPHGEKDYHPYIEGVQIGQSISQEGEEFGHAA